MCQVELIAEHQPQQPPSILNIDPMKKGGMMCMRMITPKAALRALKIFY